MLEWEESMLIKIMYQQGKSKKAIARELGISINTVRKYIAVQAKPVYKQRIVKPSKLGPYREYIKQRISQAHPAWLPATVIFSEIKSQGYSGGISMLRQYMLTLKPEVKERPLQRFETEPGKQMQVDWAEFRRGQNRMAAFVATLGYSRASYVEFVSNEKLATLLSCHENAFDYFGGVPYDILYDNMKTVITARNYYGDGLHRLQSGFWDFSKHHGFRPRICRPYRAQTKGKVERFIHYLRYSFYQPLVAQLKGSSLCLDIAIANQKVLSWLNEVANQRIHGTTSCVPWVRLQEEQACLQPLTSAYQGACITCDDSGSLPTSRIKNDCAGNDTIQHPLSDYATLLGEQQS